MLARAKALEAQGRDIIHLEIGQPDFPTPAHIAEAGVEAIRAGHTRYTPPAGARDLRVAIAETAGPRRGLQFAPEEVVVGPGAKPAMFCAIMALVAAGDEVILPDPGFPSYAATIRVAGAVPVPVRLAPGKAAGDQPQSDAPRSLQTFDMDEFEARIGPRTRLVILNSPSNPTGGVAQVGDLERLAAAVRRTDAWVLSDEILYPADL